MSIKEIFVPDIGDFDSVEVTEILIAVGDEISADDSLVTVESDKASMEIPSSDAGKVAQGDLIITVESTDSAAAEPVAEEPEKAAEAPVAEETKPAPAPVAEEAPAAPAEGQTTTIKEIIVPDIGDFDSVEITELLVAEGDVIEAEDSLITVESDKASMEIPSSESGKVVNIKVAIGDSISEGSVMLLMEVTSGGAPAAPTEKKEPAKGNHEQSTPAQSAVKDASIAKMLNCL